MVLYNSTILDMMSKKSPKNLRNQRYISDVYVAADRHSPKKKKKVLRYVSSYVVVLKCVRNLKEGLYKIRTSAKNPFY
jgi:hypothetical protein